jgi:hypothetical protein
MDEQLLGYVELLRGVFEPGRVRTGSPVTADQLANVEYKLGITLPEEYKAVASSLGYVCEGDAGELVIFGIAPMDHGCPLEVDLLQLPPSAHETEAVIPLVRLAVADEPTRLVVLDAHGELRILVGAHHLESPASASFRAELQRVLQTAVEARMEAIARAAGVQPGHDDDALAPGQASVQLFAVPRDVVAALKKEPAVVDEITLYTSVEEFREQTLAWEKTLGPAASPTTKELVRRMRWLLGQRGIAKLKHFITGEAEIPRWTDAIVASFGETAIESLALRGKTELPSEGTDTIRMLSAGEVKQVAAGLDGAEGRLRAGYQPAALRARGLYNVDAPNEAAFLEELVALWDTVEDGIREAATPDCGWVVRRTERAPLFSR